MGSRCGRVTLYLRIVISEPQPARDPDERAGPSGISGRAVRGFAWAAVSFGGNKLLLFVSTLVLTRLLAPADFGVLAASVTVMAYLEVTLDLGMSAAIVYQQQQGQPRSVSVAFTTNIGVCLILAALNVLFAPTVATFFGVPDSVAIFRLLSVYIVVRGVGALQTALLQRDLRFREKGVADLARAIIRGGLGVILALAGLREWSLIWAFLFAEVAGTAVSWGFTRYRPRFAFDLTTAGPLLRFGAPLAALQLLSEVAVNSDYIVVGHRLGSVALGLYTIAFRLPELLLSNAFWIFSSVAFPVFSNARRAGSAALRGSMLKALRLITLFGFPVSAGLAMVARDAVHVLFGAQWSAASTSMALISLALGSSSVGYASGDIYKAAGRPATLLLINTAGTVVALTGFVLAAPHGIEAVAAVHLGFNLIYAVVRLGLANRLIGTSAGDVLRAMGPALTISAGAVLLALPVRLLTATGPSALLAIIVAGLVGGAIGLALTGGGTVRELRGLFGELGRRRDRQPASRSVFLPGGAHTHDGEGPPEPGQTHPGGDPESADPG